MLPIELFNRFRMELSSLPLKPDGYKRHDLIAERFRLFSECGLEIYYAPFHYLSKDTKVLLIGLTPGWTQIERAYYSARIGLEKGLDGEALFHYIDASSSFSGSMRHSLTSMLDGIGIHECLHVCSCDALFDVQERAGRKAGFTSVVSAPIFQNEDNYRGYSPRLLRVPSLRRWVVKNLATEIASVPEALIVPLGQVANEAIEFVAEQQGRKIHPERCLVGFPHPSRANGHRKLLFEHGRQHWMQQAQRFFSR